MQNHACLFVQDKITSLLALLRAAPFLRAKGSLHLLFSRTSPNEARVLRSVSRMLHQSCVAQSESAPPYQQSDSPRLKYNVAWTAAWIKVRLKIGWNNTYYWQLQCERYQEVSSVSYAIYACHFQIEQDTFQIQLYTPQTKWDTFKTSKFKLDTFKIKVDPLRMVSKHHFFEIILNIFRT